jgi:hypothetical protein
MHKQHLYVPPGLAICRIEMEASIAVLTSIGTVSSAQVGDWNSTTVTYGAASNGEGEVYLSW